MILALFVTGWLLGGHALSTWLWRRGGAAPGPMERATSSMLLATALWIATAWLLSPPALLARGPLLAASAIVGMAGVAVTRKLAAHQQPQIPGRWTATDTAVLGLACLPIALWLGYVLWRGWYLPVCHHDALSYHMPKAVFIARAGGYRWFEAADFRISSYPSNYEMLAATVLAVDRSDRATSALSTLHYVFLLLGSGALAERWWGRGLHVLAAVLLVAGAPVVLLHSGTHKNDLLVAGMFVAAFVWAGRWASERRPPALLLTIVATAIAVGTKPQGFYLIAALGAVLSVVCLDWWRKDWRPSPRHVLATGALTLGSLILLGGCAYLVKLRHTGTLFGLPADDTANHSMSFGWGDLTNLLEVPALLMLAPFSSKATEVPVPWRHASWFWPRYELYFSHFGASFTVLVLALPVAAFLAHRAAPSSARRERVVASAIALLALALLLPMRMRPVGFFAYFPRFMIFVLPIIACWTAAPAASQLLRVHRSGWLRAGGVSIVLASAAVFVVHALDYGEHDTFSSFAYARKAAQHDRYRVLSAGRDRAGSFVDRVAGRDDVVAVHDGMNTWVYPAFGRDLTRPVVFVRTDGGHVVVPPEARWVMVDRSWNRVWGHPDLKDMGGVGRYLGRGPLSTEDTIVIRALSSDPAFELVYLNQGSNQAVFRRRDR